MSMMTPPKVHAIKPAVALVKHDEDQAGYASLRTITFDEHGRVTVTAVELTREEVIQLGFAASDVAGPGDGE